MSLVRSSNKALRAIRWYNKWFGMRNLRREDTLRRCYWRLFLNTIVWLIGIGQIICCGIRNIPITDFFDCRVNSQSNILINQSSFCFCSQAEIKTATWGGGGGVTHLAFTFGKLDLALHGTETARKNAKCKNLTSAVYLKESLSVYVVVCAFVCVFVCVFSYLSVSVCLRVCLSLPLSIAVCLCLSLYVSFCRRCLSLSVPVCFWPSLSLSLSVSVWSGSVRLCLSLAVSV